MMGRASILAATSAVLALGSAAYAQGGFTLQGTVTAPRGVSVEGSTVIACSVPYQECKTQISGPVGADGRFSLSMPNKGPYQVLAMLDRDGDGNGEYLAVAQDAAAITAPAANIDMAMSAPGRAQKAAANSNADVPQFAGVWTQSSTTTELVLGSSIKQIASAAVTPGYGTDLGGTFGAGSATNSVIVTESKPVPVNRRMNLNVAPDGTYRWTITKSMPEGGCTKTIKQEKVGRILTQGSQITFATNSGTESWSSSCGGGGSSKIGKSHETYDYRRNGNMLTVSGSGGVRWDFRRG